MSHITISKAAEILGVSKKTLFRWDKENRFNPSSREQVSRFRLYDEADVEALRAVLDHEKRVQDNAKAWKQVLNELTQDKSLLLTDKYIKLSESEEELRKKHKELMDKFKAQSPTIHSLYRKFFKI